MWSHSFLGSLHLCYVNLCMPFFASNLSCCCRIWFWEVLVSVLPGLTLQSADHTPGHWCSQKPEQKTLLQSAFISFNLLIWNCNGELPFIIIAKPCSKQAGQNHPRCCFFTLVCEIQTCFQGTHFSPLLANFILKYICYQHGLWLSGFSGIFY